MSLIIQVSDPSELLDGIKTLFNTTTIYCHSLHIIFKINKQDSHLIE